MKNVSISEKLVFYFVLIGIISIAIVSTYSYYNAKSALLNRTFDQLISLRIEKKNRVEQFFLDRQRDLNLIAKSSEISYTFSIINTNQRIEDCIANTIDTSLFQFIKSFGYFRKFFLISKQLSVFSVDSSGVCKVKDDAKRNSIIAFCNNLKTSHNSMFQDLSKRNPMISIGKNIFSNDGSNFGFLVFEIPMEEVNKIMFEYNEANGLGKTGESYLVGSDSLMRSNSRFKGDAILNIKVNSNSVVNALKGKTGIDIIFDYRNKSCLSSYSAVSINGLNWVILAEIDEHEAMIPIYNIRNSILLLSIIIAAFVFMFAIFIASKISSPLKKLQKASKLIGSGEYQIDLLVTSKDEIGSLTATFIEMCRELKNKSLELEEEKIKRLGSLIDGQEMERKRLSRDLHDSLGQSLLAIKLKLEQARTSNEEKKQRYLLETQELLRSAINEIKELTNNLTPQVLDAFGLIEGINNLCNSFKEHAEIEILFNSKNIPDNLNKRIQIYLYRILQEALNNIIKHANASKVNIDIYCQNNFLHLNVSDNGVGFNYNDISKAGNGLKNMMERAELLQGNCKIISSIGIGSEIRIVIPINYE